MDMTWCKDGHKTLAGRIFIYKRPHSNNYQCRLLIPGNKGYIIQSCKTSSFAEASRFAFDLYDKLRFKILNKLPLEVKTFNQIFKEFVEHANKSEYREDFCKGTFKRYLSVYFGKYNIEEITSVIADNYFLWRKNYYKLFPKQKNGNVTKIPSESTLRMEKQLILEIFNYAFVAGYINRVPKINFKVHKNDERRDPFEPNEYKQIVKGFKKLSEQKNIAKNNLYQLKMIYNFIIFLRHTGLRVGEAYALKCCDVKAIQHQNEQGDMISLLHVYVPKKTKTGKRTVVSLPEAFTAYSNIKKFSMFQKPDDYFFNNYDGSIFDGSSKTFITYLKKWGLYISKDGGQRPYYSLRHTYATEQIKNGVDIYDLALNMGTGIKQIENHYSHVLAIQKTGQLIKGSKKSSLQRTSESIGAWYADDLSAEQTKQALKTLQEINDE